MISASSPAPVAFKRAGYTGALLTTATLAGLAGFFVIVLATGSELTNLLPDLERDPTVALAHTRLLEVIIAAPALCSALGALMLWRMIWVVRVTRYMRFMRAYCRERLRREAPLITLGFTPAGRVAGEPTRESKAVRPVMDLLNSTRSALLLGGAGSGKTTALLTAGEALSERSVFSRLLFGVRRERLPVLVSLPGMATQLRESRPEGSGDTTHYVASLLARLGTPGLGARAGQLLQSGRVTLLCDDYDKLDDDERAIINQALQALREAPFRACRVVVTCDSAAYACLIDDVGPLARFDAIELAPIPATEFTLALKKRLSARRSRDKRRAETIAAITDAQRRPIGVSLGTAGVAAALTQTLEGGEDVGWGRAAVLRAALLQTGATASAPTKSAARARAKTPGADAADDSPQADVRQATLVWAALAASLQDALSGYLPLDTSRTIGESVRTWLTNHPPPGPTDFALSVDPELSGERIERDIQIGLRTGMFQRSLDGLTLRFSTTLTQASAAALWLELRDDGLGRLNTQLLRLRWALPVALWAGAQPEPYDLAHRIFRFANSPSSIAPRAGLADSLDVYPQSLALALAAVIEGAAPTVARMVAQRETGSQAFSLTQQGMRDLLDASVVYGADAERRPRLTRALSRIQQEVGVEFVLAIGSLARESALDRLLRAQLVLALGLTSTPEAMDELMSLLMESDPTMRQAVEQALIYAGVSAVPALQAVVRAGSAPARQRAEEALRLLNDAAPTTGETARRTAITGLSSPDAAQRRVAVATLSAIGASQALNDLIARLDDISSDVRVAAAGALGQLGGKRALLALRRRANSDDARLRLAVAQALGQDPVPASVPPLLRLIKDHDARVRAAAATSLGSIADKRAISALREASEDADPWVRHAAQTASRRYTHP